MVPQVTVIITTYNRVNLLERAVRSVLSQIFRNFEVIVIDDASTDTTLAMLLNKFKQEIDSGMVRYEKNRINIERSRSRNKGVAIAQGEYIAFLDDDDIWLPDHLCLLVSFLENNIHIGCVFGKPVWLYENGLIEDKLNDLFPDMKTGCGSFYKRAVFRGHLVAPPCALLRKCVFHGIQGFREDISQNEDWEFFSRVAMHCDVGYINAITCCFYVHTGTYSRSVVGKGAYLKENVLKIIEENSIKYDFTIDNDINCLNYIRMSADFIPLMDKSREYLFKALKICPVFIFKLSTWGLLFRVVLGETLYLRFKQIKGLLK